MTRQVRNKAYERTVYVETEEELSRFESFLNSIECKWQSGSSLRTEHYFCKNMYFHVDWNSWDDKYVLTKTSGGRGYLHSSRDPITVDEYLRKVGYSGYSVPSSTYKQAALDALTIED